MANKLSKEEKIIFGLSIRYAFGIPITASEILEKYNKYGGKSNSIRNNLLSKKPMKNNLRKI